MKRTIALLVLLIVLPLSLFAGPFGLEWGWTENDLRKNEIEYELSSSNGPVKSYIVEVQKGIDIFEIYWVNIHETKGLYNIMAAGYVDDPNTYGTNIKREFNKLKTSLTNKYGKPTSDYDFLNYDSIWDEPRDFMYALVKDEYHLFAEWEMDDLKVGLMVIPSTLSSSILTLNYDGPNANIVKKEIKEAKSQQEYDSL